MGCLYTEIVRTNMFLETCCHCGLQFGMTADFEKRRRDDHRCFYCPAGHYQHYAGDSEETKLKALLAEAARNADNLRAARSAAQEQAKHERIERLKLQTRHRNLKARAKHGACPCCKRQFGNVRRHMADKHPNYSPES